MAGMRDDVITLIEASQPYAIRPEAPRQSLLWLIHDLNNVDKHRVLNLSGLHLYELLVAWRLPEGVGMDAIKTHTLMERGSRIETDAVLGHFTWDSDRLKFGADVNMQFRAYVDIGFTNGPEFSQLGNPAEGRQFGYLMQCCLDYVRLSLIPELLAAHHREPKWMFLSPEMTGDIQQSVLTQAGFRASRKWQLPDDWQIAP